MLNHLVAVLALAVLFSFTACDDEGTTTPTLGKTPAQVLEALERAFQDRDAELLDGLLDTDFTFHFDPNDVGNVIGDYTIPDTWGKEEFLAACGNMYDLAFDIDFGIAIESIGEPDDGAIEFTAWNVLVTLTVMVDPTNGFRASGPCDFRFINDDSAGYDDWVITDWWDKTAYGCMEEPTAPASLGYILASFR